MEHRLRERKHSLQTIEPLPVDLGFLAASLQSFEPHPLYLLLELAQRPVVEDETVVAIVTAQYLTQPGMLLGHFGMPAFSQLHS
jgi:hypothetical protein